MRIILGMLGVILLIQALLHLGVAITDHDAKQGGLSEAIGQTLNGDLIRFTLGLTAIAVSQLLGRQKMADKT